MASGEDERGSLTLVEHGRVVVDVGERDVDRGGARQTPQLPAHVLGLDDHRVVLSGLPVHVRQRHPEHACGEPDKSEVRKRAEKNGPRKFGNTLGVATSKAEASSLFQTNFSSLLAVIKAQFGLQWDLIDSCRAAPAGDG